MTHGANPVTTAVLEKPAAVLDKRAVARHNARRVLLELRHSPVTVGLVVVLWVLGAVSDGWSVWSTNTDDLPSTPHGLVLKMAVGTSQLQHGLWWTPLTAGFWNMSLAAYVVITLLALVIGVPAERLLGRRLTALVLILGQVLSSLLGVGAVALLAPTGDSWLTSLDKEVAVGTSPALVCLGVVLTFKLSALWRRRLRLLLFSSVVVFSLYSGTLLDVLRVFGAVVGLLVGWLLYRSEIRVVVSPSSRSEARVLVATVVAATAFGPIVTLLASPGSWLAGHGPLRTLEYLFASPAQDTDRMRRLCADPALSDACRLAVSQTLGTGVGSAITSVGPALLLLAAAVGLRHGRRFAWWLALLLNTALVAGSVWFAVLWTRHAADLHSSARNAADLYSFAHDKLILVAPIIVPCLVIVLLLFTRRLFTVTAPRATYLRLGLGLAITALLTGGGYLLIAYWERSEFDPPPDFARLVADLPARYLPPDYALAHNAKFLPKGGLGLLAWEFCGAGFWVMLLAGLLVSFWRAHITIDDQAHTRARDLMEANSGSSLAYMSTWPGNVYWFTEDGRAALAYRVVATVALTTGGPLGDPGAQADAIRGFERFCDRNGWTACMYSITEDVRDTAVELGWNAVQVAEDTVVPLAELEFKGKKWQDIRTALNKATREGIRAEWINYPDAPLSIRDQVRVISEEWVADKGMPEMGWTLGGLDELDDPTVRCLIAVDDQWIVHGITSWLPVYRDRQAVGWTLDFMRRRGSSTFKGVMEFLIASAAQLFKDEGAEFLSLSGAPLARLARGKEVTTLERILDVTGKALEPVYGFRSLLSFKAKFQPEYRPLYMAYRNPSALPAIGNAISRAYLPNLTARQGIRLVRTVARR
jgi:phosphatidylglycerol lysyltransferase